MEGTSGIYFVKRIDSQLEKMGIKRAQFLRLVGLPRNAIGNWNERGNIPSGDVCVKIADFLNVSVDWLISGEEIEGLSNEERWLLKQWEQITPEQKDTVRTLLEKWEAVRTAFENSEGRA